MPFVSRLPLRGLLLSAVLLLTGAAIASPIAITLADDGDGIAPQAAAGNTFTYQGRLEIDGVPANGNHEFSFELFADAAGTSSVAFTQLTRPVVNGLFTAELGFGDGAFNGDERWLQVYVKQGANFVPVGTVQKLTATPYAITALNFPDHDHFLDSWSGNTVGSGLSISNSGTGRGITVTTTGTNSTGVYATNSGNCSSNGQTCYGVWGTAMTFPGGSGFGGVGVRGDGTNTGVLGTGPQYGVYGTTDDGIAIQAYTVNGTGMSTISGSTSGTDAALKAESTQDADAVQAKAFDGTAVSAESTNSTAVFGQGRTGVQGYANVAGGQGVHGVANVTNGIAVNGFSSLAVGVRGAGGKAGVWASVGGGSSSLPTGTWAGYFEGNVHTTGVFTQVSDARLKNNIRDITYGLDTVMDIRPVAYALNDDPESKEHLGVIAQEMESVLPGVVNRPENPDEMLAVNYTELIPVLIKAVQEQQAQIEALSTGPIAPAQDVPASLGVDTSAAPDAGERLVALEAEVAGLRAQNGNSGSNGVPLLPAAIVGLGIAGAGFAIGRGRRA